MLGHWTPRMTDELRSSFAIAFSHGPGILVFHIFVAIWHIYQYTLLIPLRAPSIGLVVSKHCTAVAHLAYIFSPSLRYFILSAAV
jgi:hypothetical protein